MKKDLFLSLIFYMGSKYQIMQEIKPLLPTDINRLIEPFVGGGSFFLNVEANEFLLNDFDSYIIALHKMLQSYIGHEEELRQSIYAIIHKYGLSLSFEGITPSKEMRQAFPKSYNTKYNAFGYMKLRDDFNAGGAKDMIQLYVLMLYGFSRMIRFNSHGEFNVPVGDGDFSKRVQRAFKEYYTVIPQKITSWYNMDFRDFLHSIEYMQGDLVYLDPPYHITDAVYNKTWTEETEKALLMLIDELDCMGVRFAVSNVTHYRDKVNTLFLEWSMRYNSHPINSRYQSFHDNQKKFQKEVLVTNF